MRWELDINPRWKRDPNFYIEQTLTPIAEAFLVPGPYDEARSNEILTRIENIPSILQQGAANLDKPPGPFATVAIQALDGVRDRLRKMSKALPGSTMLKEADLNGAVERAAIPVERTNGPILLVSGQDDQMWPSAQMGQLVIERLDQRTDLDPSLNRQ